jgi:hypothetical protein
VRSVRDLLAGDLLEICNNICAVLFTFESGEIHFRFGNVFFGVQKIFEQSLLAPDHTCNIKKLFVVKCLLFFGTNSVKAVLAIT